MSRLTVRMIEDRVDQIAGRSIYDRDFLFELLLAYGQPKSTVTRLKQGPLNVAQNSRDLLLKKIVFFRDTDSEPLGELNDMVGSGLIPKNRCL